MIHARRDGAFGGGGESTPGSMEFQRGPARDRYLTHPDHEKVKAMVLGHLDNGIAFDFEA